MGQIIVQILVELILQPLIEVVGVFVMEIVTERQEARRRHAIQLEREAGDPRLSLLRSSTTPGTASQTLLRAAQSAPEIPSDQLLRADFSKKETT